MSVVTSIWLASFAGAVLFYLAGALTGRRRSATALEEARAERDLARSGAARGDGEAKALEAAWAGEADRLRSALTEAHGEAERQRAVADAARAEAQRLDDVRRRVEAEVASMRGIADGVRVDARHAEDARRKLEAEAAALRGAADTARADLRRVEEAKKKLENDGRQAEAARHELEAEIAQVRIEAARVEAALRDAEAAHRAAEDARRAAEDDRRAAAARADDAAARAERAEIARVEVARGAAANVQAAEAARRALASQLDELRARPAEPESDNDAALRLDLAVQSELVRARTDESDRLRDENARLRQRVAELTTVEGRLTAALAENDELRAEGFRAGVTRPGRSEPHPSATASSLQELVERVGGLKSVRAAVITDELGLVVAATGEYSDVLAAFGRHLADEGQRVRELLPLHDIRQLSVHDDHDVTMTVRPLAVGDYNLALVTLGIGAESEGDMRELLAPTL